MTRKAYTLTRTVATAVTLAAPVAGCNTYDPLLRAGVWHPIGVNRTNETLMAANPADLVRGHGVQGSDGVLASAAVDRLMNNKVKKLPDSGLSDVAVKSQGSAAE